LFQETYPDGVERYLQEKGKTIYQLSVDELGEVWDLKSWQDKSKVLAHDILIMAQKRGLTKAELTRAFQICDEALNVQAVSVENAEVVFDLR